MKEYDNATVNCKRIAINPCAEDEYKVTIKSNGLEYVMYTFGGIFEPDESICDRMYQQWLKESKFNQQSESPAQYRRL